MFQVPFLDIITVLICTHPESLYGPPNVQEATRALQYIDNIFGVTIHIRANVEDFFSHIALECCCFIFNNVAALTPSFMAFRAALSCSLYVAFFNLMFTVYTRV